MRILMVNNQLSVLGGSETYMFSLGDELIKQGHDVEYFGKKDPNNLHGNKYNIYAKSSMLPWKQIKNRRNIKKFGKILDVYKPDAVHLNLIYFVLTPGIIYEAKRRNIKIVQTVHDPKIVCPNHRFYIERSKSPCLECVGKKYENCLKHKCIKNSYALSQIAYKESKYCEECGIYDLVDAFIFPSEFMCKQHLKSGISNAQSIILHNFSRMDFALPLSYKKAKEKYVLFFGRISEEKGIKTLLEVIEQNDQINYVFVGSGPLENELQKYKNVKSLGFKTGNELKNVVENACLSVFPSIWYENCPMSILESISLGTPVVGANIGGIPELIDDGKTGLLFNSGDSHDLKEKIEKLYFDNITLERMSKFCLNTEFRPLNVEDYAKKILEIYTR